MSASRIPRLLTLAAAASAVLGLAACGSSAITRPRLERSLPASFSNQYVRQAKILGHTGITVASLHARAQCDKGGPKVADTGPGADWICFMYWTDPNVPIPDGSAKFELNAKSNGCYTATGPTKLVGLRSITDAEGTFVDNPVFEFDTCFDPNGSNAATRVRFPPAALALPAGTVKPDAHSVISPALTCTVGPLGCSGTVSGTLGTRVLGTNPYSLAPGGASATRFAIRPGEKGRLILRAAPSLGGVKAKTAVLRVP